MARRYPEGQLELFGESRSGSARSESLHNQLIARFDELRTIADRLPDDVKLGTSSWSFPGWAGLVFPEGMSKTQLARDGLPLYLRHPLMRTVGIDRGYYAPIPQEDLVSYASQLPGGYPTVAKVPGTFTTPVHLGHGSAARGSPNPSFLDAALFREVVVQPFASVFRDHTAALVLEFPPVPKKHRLTPEAFADRLDTFFTEVGTELPYCVEIRDVDLLSPAYADVLSKHGVAHVFNYWTAMPMPIDQASIAPLDSASFVVMRLMLRPGTRYADRQAEFKPFDRIVDPDPDMRAQVKELVEMARALKRVVLVLVNNKAEGSAPLTIEALAREITGA